MFGSVRDGSVRDNFNPKSLLVLLLYIFGYIPFSSFVYRPGVIR